MPSLVQLSERHRAAQARLASTIARLIAASYRTTIPGSFRDDTLVDAWLATMVPLVQLYRERSTDLSAVYYGSIRDAVGEDSPLGPIDLDPLPDEAVATSLRVTGVIGLVEALNAGDPFEQAVERGATLAQGAASRHALSGGRSYLDRAYQADRTRLAWYRVTQPGACSWCAMQASRGAVFREDSWDDSDARHTGEGDVKGHDHCRCTKGFVELGQDAPEFNLRMRQLWDDSTKGKSGRAARLAFRHAYEAATV